jgi:hypothetical protein
MESNEPWSPPQHLVLALSHIADQFSRLKIHTRLLLMNLAVLLEAEASGLQQDHTRHVLRRRRYNSLFSALDTCLLSHLLLQLLCALFLHSSAEPHTERTSGLPDYIARPGLSAVLGRKAMTSLEMRKHFKSREHAVKADDIVVPSSSLLTYLLSSTNAEARAFYDFLSKRLDQSGPATPLASPSRSASPPSATPPPPSKAGRKAQQAPLSSEPGAPASAKVPFTMNFVSSTRPPSPPQGLVLGPKLWCVWAMCRCS